MTWLLMSSGVSAINYQAMKYLDIRNNLQKKIVLYREMHEEARFLLCLERDCLSGGYQGKKKSTKEAGMRAK